MLSKAGRIEENAKGIVLVIVMEVGVGFGGCRLPPATPSVAFTCRQSCSGCATTDEEELDINAAYAILLW